MTDFVWGMVLGMCIVYSVQIVFAICRDVKDHFDCKAAERRLHRRMAELDVQISAAMKHLNEEAKHIVEGWYIEASWDGKKVGSAICLHPEDNLYGNDPGEAVVACAAAMLEAAQPAE